jgi:hypothetical protein
MIWINPTEADFSGLRALQLMYYTFCRLTGTMSDTVEMLFQWKLPAEMISLNDL